MLGDPALATEFGLGHLLESPPPPSALTVDEQVRVLVALLSDPDDWTTLGALGDRMANIGVGVRLLEELNDPIAAAALVDLLISIHGGRSRVRILQETLISVAENLGRPLRPGELTGDPLRETDRFLGGRSFDLYVEFANDPTIRPLLLDALADRRLADLRARGELSDGHRDRVNYYRIPHP